MKKLLIVLVGLMFMAAGMFAQAGEKDLSIGIMGMATFNQNDEAIGEYNFWENSVWGVTGRLMLTDNIGLNADFLYVMRKYYDTNGFGTFWGPNPASYYGFTDAQLENWPYYEDKFLLNLNIGGYLPIGMFQPFAQIGPTFTVTTPSDAYDDFDTSFHDYYDLVNDDSVVGMGYNLKFGSDIFISEDWSFSLAYTLLEPSFGDFFTKLETEGCGYILASGYFTLDVLLWL